MNAEKSFTSDQAVLTASGSVAPFHSGQGKPCHGGEVGMDCLPWNKSGFKGLRPVKTEGGRISLCFSGLGCGVLGKLPCGPSVEST